MPLFGRRNSRFKIVAGDDDAEQEPVKGNTTQVDSTENDPIKSELEDDKGMSQKDVDAAFNEFCGGAVEMDAARIKEVLSANNVNVTDQDLKALIEEVDIDGNGAIDLHEFREMLTNADKHKNSSAEPFLLAAKRSLLKAKRSRLSAHSVAQPFEKVQEMVRQSVGQAQAPLKFMKSIPVELVETRNVLNWRTKERIAWNIYWAEQPALLGVKNRLRLAVVQPFKDDGWCQYDCIACDLDTIELQIRALRADASGSALPKSSVDVAALKHSRGESPLKAGSEVSEITRAAVCEFLSARILYTPEIKPSTSSASLADKSNANSSGNDAGMSTSKSLATLPGNDPTPTDSQKGKKASGTVTLTRLSRDTADVHRPFPEGLIIPAVKAICTKFKRSSHVEALTSNIKSDIEQASKQAMQSKNCMQALQTSIDILSTLSNDAEAERQLSIPHRRWRMAFRRVGTRLQVERFREQLKQLGYTGMYLGSEAPVAVQVLKKEESEQQAPQLKRTLRLNDA